MDSTGSGLCPLVDDASCEAQKWIALAQGYAHW